MEGGKTYVSVIIPIYNGAKYLKKCLNSVVNQTLEGIEILCIDDGSVDDTYRILENYSKSYPGKVKVFHTKNQGVWKARELGLKMACGTYVGFVDCDDDIEPDMYEKMYEFAAHNEAEMAITAYWRVIDPDKKGKQTVEMYKQGNAIWNVDHDFYRFAFINTALWNKIVLRDIALKYVRFEAPPRVAEDALFLLSIYPYVRRVVFLETPLYRYYVRNGTAISYVDIKEMDNILEDFSLTKNYIKNFTRNKEWEDTFEIASYIHLGASLLLRCRVSESAEYIKKVTLFLKKEFSYPNLYLKNMGNRFLKIKLIQFAYRTKMVYCVPYFKKVLMRVVKW